MQLNFVASSPHNGRNPAEKIEDASDYPLKYAHAASRFILERDHRREWQSSARLIQFFMGLKKNPEIEIGRPVVDGIAKSGASRGYAFWIIQDARRARNVERDRNERKGRGMEEKKKKKKGAATGGSQRVSVKERFKASLILVLNDEIGNDRRKLRTH